MTELELAMRKLANTVKLDTIEACARVANDYPPPEGVTDDYQSGFIDAIIFIAERIRALSERTTPGKL